MILRGICFQRFKQDTFRFTTKEFKVSHVSIPNLIQVNSYELI